MKQIKVVLLCCMLAGISFAAGMRWEKGIQKDLESQVIRASLKEKASDVWGEITILTDEQTNTFGTTNTVSGIAEIKPGQEIHPAHEHTEEEFLFIIEGSGTWNVKGNTSQANAGDLLYAKPWDLHGIKNTGSETMKFFFLKWNNKGVAKPIKLE